MAAPWENDPIVGRVGQITPIGPRNPKLPGEVEGLGVSNAKGRAETVRTQTQNVGDMMDNDLKRQTNPLTVRKSLADAIAAEATAAEARAKADKIKAARDRAAAELINGIGTIDNVNNHLDRTGGWWEVGKSGALPRNGIWPILGGKGAEGQPDGVMYAGSDAADFDAATKPIVSNMALDALKAMRDANPNGTGLGGNTSDRDMRVLETSTADLSPSQSTKGYQQSLRKARSAYVRNLGNIDKDAAGAAIAGNPDLTTEGARNAQRQGLAAARRAAGSDPAKQRAAAERYLKTALAKRLAQRSGQWYSQDGAGGGDAELDALMSKYGGGR